MTRRVVIDTNILVSALMKPSSAPGEVLKRVLSSRELELVVSEDILDEVERVQFYPKVRKRISGSDEDLRHWIQAITVVAHVVTPVYDYDPFIEADPDDDKFVIAALESEADVIVSGDAHLLACSEIEGVKVYTARDYLHVLDG